MHSVFFHIFSLHYTSRLYIIKEGNCSEHKILLEIYETLFVICNRITHTHYIYKTVWLERRNAYQFLKFLHFMNHSNVVTRAKIFLLTSTTVAKRTNKRISKCELHINCVRSSSLSHCIRWISFIMRLQNELINMHE